MGSALSLGRLFRSGCSLVLIIISVPFLFCSTSHRSKRKEQVSKYLKKVGS
jgi:hypothetical protein